MRIGRSPNSEVSMEQETKIRSLLSGGLSNSYISATVDICRDTINRRRKLYASVDAITESDRNSIRAMLWEGIPIGAISVKLKIPETSVLNVQFFDVITAYRNDSLVKKCQECGSAIYPPCQTGGSNFTAARTKLSREVTQHEGRQLYGIALELLQLHDLHLITNPMFFDLAQRAERVMDEINAKEKKTCSGKAGCISGPDTSSEVAGYTQSAGPKISSRGCPRCV